MSTDAPSCRELILMRARRRRLFGWAVAVFIVMELMASCTLMLRAMPPERYEVACPDALWTRSQAIARTQIGVRERTGRNDGPRIAAYLRTVSLSVGNPYCQAGQYWSFDSAATELGISKTLIPLKRTGSTQAAFADVRARGRRTDVMPKPGDLLTWTCARNPAQGHVDRIEQVLAGGWLKLLGFNIGVGGTDGERDGGGVGVRMRNWMHPNMRMLVRGFTGHYNKGPQQ